MAEGHEFIIVTKGITAWELRTERRSGYEGSVNVTGRSVEEKGEGKRQGQKRGCPMRE